MQSRWSQDRTEMGSSVVKKRSGWSQAVSRWGQEGCCEDEAEDENTDGYQPTNQWEPVNCMRD